MRFDLRNGQCSSGCMETYVPTHEEECRRIGDEIADEGTQVDAFRIMYTISKGKTFRLRSTSKGKTFLLGTSDYSSVVARGNKPHGNGLQRHSYPWPFMTSNILIQKVGYTEAYKYSALLVRGVHWPFVLE